MVGTIEPRFGAEVYVSEAGKACIRQNQGVEHELVLIFDEDEVDALIDLLKGAKAEIAEDRRVLEENASQ
jgi:hypothetical protein